MAEPYNRTGTPNTLYSFNWVSLATFIFDIQFVVEHILWYFSVTFCMSLLL
jgi:hypothetical protein